MMKVSEVIPCHNAGRWIASCAAQQTHPAAEIIVIDESSSDSSLAEIDASGVDVKLLRVNARNAAAARNAGIKAASADWIALLDARCLGDHLARAAELLARTEDVAFLSNHDWIALMANFCRSPTSFSAS
jgi:glycosyltransferase involved in cell wall biosynthesis